MKPKFDISEIMIDARMVDCNKQDIREKYGISSNKAAEIQMALYDMANQIRREHTKPTDEDVMVFNKRWNFPASPKKIRDAMADESTDFVKFYLTYKMRNSRPYDRTWNSVVTAIRSIIEDRKNESDTILHTIIDSLTAQTSDFRAVYMKKALYIAERQFAFLEEEFKGLDTIADIVEKFGDIGHKKLNKIWSESRKAKSMTHGYDKDLFMKDRKEHAERDFKNAIELIAQRIRKSGMDPNIQVNQISDDAKAFDIHVTDGTRSMHARSILAAEFSTLVTPHFRFIITNE